MKKSVLILMHQFHQGLHRAGGPRLDPAAPGKRHPIRPEDQPAPAVPRIGARLPEGRLLLMMENTGHWVEPHGPGSTGLGLANLRKRLHLLYGDQAGLTFERTATAVRAQVSFPVSGSA